MVFSDKEQKAHIKEAQYYLNAVSQLNPHIPTVIPDGIYNDETKAAVKAFQAEYGLPVTGEIDADTWEQLYDAYLAAEAHFAVIEPILPFQSREKTIKSGDAGYPIYIIQVMLNTVAQFYDNFEAVEINGIHDAETIRAIKQIQIISGVEPSGNIDRETWEKLARVYNFHAVLDEVESQTQTENNAVMTMNGNVG